MRSGYGKGLKREVLKRWSVGALERWSDQPQSGCVTKPRVARDELPWETSPENPSPTPTGLRHIPVSQTFRARHNPVGIDAFNGNDVTPLGYPVGIDAFNR